MGNKRKNKTTCFMQDWPEDDTCGIDISNIVYPLKKIVYEGYEIKRKSEKSFLYAGYNIGLAERAIYSPTPEERFSSRWLANDAKFDRTLLDNVLVTAIQLGIEQGRRLSQTKRNTNEILLSIIDRRTQEVHRLRAKLQAYGDLEEFTPQVRMEVDDQSLMIDEMEEELDLSNVDT